MGASVMNYAITTTLREIRAAGPCGIRKADNCGWGKLLSGLGEKHRKPNLDREVTVLEVLDINGLDDALWVLRVPSLERLSRHFQAWCAEQVLHLFEAERPDDHRIRAQISMLRNDDATDKDRAVASAAASDAAVAARDAARAAASDAAWALADAARDAAWAAAWDAAWAAASDAARAAAWAAAWAAASDAARAAAWAAAGRAASDAARDAQERQLRGMIGGGV